MELFTTAALWKNYNRRAQPLETTVIHSIEGDKYTTEYVFFNGDPSADGCVRIYAQYIKTNKNNGCGIVLMNDVTDVFDSTYTDMLVELGYNVLVIDYVGKRDTDLYTVYPYSLRGANYFQFPGTVHTLPDNPKETCWCIWATLMLRGVTFLEQQPEITGKIGIFGVRTGGFQVWKAAFVEPELACGIALFNTGYLEGFTFDGMKQVQYNTCIDNIPYASEVRVPVLIEAASNASDNSIEYMSNLYNGIKNPNCVFSIGERRDELLNREQIDNISIFLGYYMQGKNTLPEQPLITVRESEHGLYYDIKIDTSLPVSDVKLYVSQGDMPFSYRNWHSYPITPVSDGDYISRINVNAPKEALCSFVTVKYADTLRISSELINNVPFLMNVYPSPVAKSHLLYSEQEGVDDWTVLVKRNTPKTVENIGSASIDPYLGEGPYGIKGVTSDLNTISTFKFGEYKYRFEGKTFMQMTAYTEHGVRVTVTVTVNRGGKFENYKYYTHVVGFKEWVKINLSAEEFRNGSVRLDNFDGINCFRVESDEKILINSIIMV